MNNLSKMLLLCLVLGMIVGCGKDEVRTTSGGGSGSSFNRRDSGPERPKLPEPVPDPHQPVPNPHQVVIEGVMRYWGIEGGCWTLEELDPVVIAIFPPPPSPQKRKFEPISKDRELYKPGLHVRATLRLRPDRGSICMMAPLAEVMNYEVLSSTPMR